MVSKKMIEGVVIGAVMGAMAGLLLAPKSGRETREDIKETFNNIKDDVSTEVRSMKRMTKERYNDMVDKIITGYKEAKKITPGQADEIARILDDSFEKIKEAMKEA